MVPGRACAAAHTDVLDPEVPDPRSVWVLDLKVVDQSLHGYKLRRSL